MSVDCVKSLGLGFGGTVSGDCAKSLGLGFGGNSVAGG